MSRPQAMEPVDILLVEDNPADVLMAQEALKECKIRNNLYIARDGLEGMAFLRRQGEYSTSPRPDLILLDLNLPKKDGREMLQDIKVDPDLRRIPIVILTTPDADEDIPGSHDLPLKGKMMTHLVTLKLYIAGRTQRSNRAIENLRKICEHLMPGGYEIRIIDILSHPQEAEEDRILATPTLIKVAPGQVVRVIGDLSETEMVLKALDLEPRLIHSELY